MATKKTKQETLTKEQPALEIESVLQVEQPLPETVVLPLEELPTSIETAIEETIGEPVPEVFTFETPSDYSFTITLDDKLYGVTISNQKLTWHHAMEWAQSNGKELPNKVLIDKCYLQSKQLFGKHDWWTSSLLHSTPWFTNFNTGVRTTKAPTKYSFAFTLTEIQ